LNTSAPNIQQLVQHEQIEAQEDQQ
jgi:hypothetical protein